MDSVGDEGPEIIPVADYLDVVTAEVARLMRERPMPIDWFAQTIYPGRGLHIAWYAPWLWWPQPRRFWWRLFVLRRYKNARSLDLPGLSISILDDIHGNFGPKRM